MLILDKSRLFQCRDCRQSPGGTLNRTYSATTMPNSHSGKGKHTMTTIITAHEYEQEHEYEDETTETQVCDSCLDIAWDMGVKEYDEQVRVMMEIGDVCSYHSCDKFEEPDITITCDCPGHSQS